MLEILQEHRITHYKTSRTIFRGFFISFKHAIETAIEKGIDLDYADLTDKDLSNATLDGANLSYANFSGSNCADINLSDCNLTGAVFSGTNLYHACLCESNLRDTRFLNSNLIGADIAGCTLDQTLFKDYSALLLNFRDTALIRGCLYYDSHEQHCSFSSAPIIIQGMQKKIAFIENLVDIGGTLYNPELYTPQLHQPLKQFQSFLRGFNPAELEKLATQ